MSDFDLGIEEELTYMEKEDSRDSESDAPRAVRHPSKRRRMSQAGHRNRRRHWSSESSERVYSVLVVMIGDGGGRAKCWFAKMRELDGSTLEALRALNGTEQNETDLVAKIGLKDPKWNAIALREISMTTWQRVYVVLPACRHEQTGHPVRRHPI